MEGIGRISDPNQIFKFSSQDLIKGYEELIKSTQVVSGKDLEMRRAHEEQLAQKLLSSIENATEALAKEIDSGRVVRIDTIVFEDMKKAVEIAMESFNLVDAKMKEIYFSIFGWNTRLWHALSRMQKLLMTVDLKNLSQGIKVTRIEKPQKARRKRRGQK